MAGDLNPYGFVAGSPLRFVDPVGLDECDPDITSCEGPPPDCSDEKCPSGEGPGYGGGGGGGGRGSGATGGSSGSGAPPTPPPNPGVPVETVDSGPTPFQLSIERMPGFYEEGDWQSTVYTYTQGYEYTVPMGAAAALAGVAAVIPRGIWLALSLAATTQIKSSNDAEGLFLAGSLAAGAIGAEENVQASTNTNSEVAFFLREAAAAYRDANSVAAKRNVGASVFEIGGEFLDLKVKVSGPLSETPVLEATVENGWLRTTDAEFQLSQYFASRYPTGIGGNLHIYTERAACPSCSGLPAQINQIFPNVRVNIYGGPHVR